MIHDKIEAAGKYKVLSENLSRAFELLQQGDIANKEDGRYEVDGDRLFYLVQSYVTKPVEFADFLEAIIAISRYWLCIARMPDMC